MKSFGLRMVAAALVCWSGMWVAGAQNLPQADAKPAYLNTSLPAEQRAADLVGRLTLEEKASQLVNQARAIPRLNVPAYDWWSESLHGVMRDGTTEFPEPIGLGATFDTPAIHKMAIIIGTEGRIKHVQAVRAGGSNIFEGLDFWAPNINIFRDPRWGRGQETYGEDPFLTARMGVAFVKGMQGDDPRYYRVISTPKHFAVHSGPEPTRHIADVTVSKHDELDTYLPAFRATVTEAKADSVMCAYNSINGQPACANEFLLQDQLRGKWGFKGYVVSDCAAVRNIFGGHHYEPTQAQASAISLQRGMDNECIDDTEKRTDNLDYKPYLDAVQQGFLKEGEIDVALTRLFTARMKLGMFDPPEMVPYSKIDEKLLNSAAHRALARKIANESMVLLKNDGVLPLKTSGVKIAVVGPLADQTRVLLGNYNGQPSHTVSVLEGLKAEFPNATINYVPGTRFLRGAVSVNAVPEALLTTPDGKPGLKGEYFKGTELKDKPVLVRADKTVDFDFISQPVSEVGLHNFSVRWTGFLTAAETGSFDLGARGDDGFRVWLDGKLLAESWRTQSATTLTAPVTLEKGHKYAVRMEYFQGGGGAEAHLVCAKHQAGDLEENSRSAAVAAAQSADVVVAVVGITSELEGEEMDVRQEGFKGGDRTSIDLPKPEQALLEAVAATGKPLVVVLTNGSALAVNWAKAHANAILDAFYPGEEGGAAVAETLSGRNNPAGRLPVTFYKDLTQLPPFEDYAMKGRTYRYFEGEPLYPFGYGLSYTAFKYSGLTVPTAPVAAGSPMMAEVTVTNTGKRAGDEVAQLYLGFPSVAGAPHLALRGFERIHLEAGASQKVRFALSPRDMSMVTENGVPIVAEGEYTLSVGGGQPHTGAQVLTQHFKVKGEKTLPE
jgi:beta-glucosidase